MKRVHFCVVMGWLLLLLVVGCSAPAATPEATILPAEEATVEVPAEEPTQEPTEEPAATEESTGGYEPVTLDNCGVTLTYERAPEHAVTMNQAPTEVLLALGLQDKMAGTAYIDDAILPEFEESYNQIPVLAEQYPSKEVLLAAEPDFVYGGFSSAFNEERDLHSREQLAELGINTYLSPMSCADKSLRPAVWTMETIYDEIRDLGRIFGVADRAEALIGEMQAEVDAVAEKVQGVEEPLRVLWYDSGDDEPFVGAGTGSPQEIIRLAGAENIFADVEGTWATVSWEEVISRDPEVIVLIEADWSTSEEKKTLLLENPAYAEITAVKDQRFVVIPFSYTTAGVRNAAAVTLIAEGLYPELFQ